MSDMDFQIEEIANFYGCLLIKKREDKFYCALEDFYTLTNDDWQEIPESLYDELVKFKKKLAGSDLEQAD